MNYVIFNDLSIPFPEQASDAEICHAIENFIKTLGELEQYQIKQVRSREKLADMMLTPSKALSAYVEKLENKDLQRLLLLFLTNKAKILNLPGSNFPDSEGETESHASQCAYEVDGKACDEASGLVAALELDSLAIGFYSHKRWDASFISIEKLKPEECVEQKPEECVEQLVLHASLPSHLQAHIAWLEKQKEQAEEIDFTLYEAVQKPKDFFQRVCFCDEILDFFNTKKLPREIADLALKRLCAIDRGEKQITDFNGSDESQSVEDNPELRARRKVHFNKESRYIFYHLKFAGYRLYCKEKDGIIYVGYIGIHLPTKKF